MRILVIEDDASVGRLVRIVFERDGHEVVTAATATQGLEMTQTWGPDVVVLDLGLPDMSGFDVVRRIREESDVPILILTGRGLESERVQGLDLGADDYIVKPFSLSELAARVRAVTRRSTGDDIRRPLTSLAHRDLTLDGPEHRVFRGDEEIPVTKREFEILRLLMQHPGKLVSRSAISHAVWARRAADAKNLLDVHMSSLRKKLEDRPDHPPYIETVRGEGFRLVA